MKTFNPWLLFGAVAVFIPNPAPAQTSLNLHLFAGINVTGTPGNVYVVQSTTDMSQSNSWSSLAFVQLPTTNVLFVDTTAPVAGNRFYRAQLQSPPTNMVFIPPSSFRLGSP